MSWDCIRILELLLVSIVETIFLALILNWFLKYREGHKQDKRIKDALENFILGIKSGDSELAFNSIAFLPEEDDYKLQLRLKLKKTIEGDTIKLENPQFSLYMPMYGSYNITEMLGDDVEGVYDPIHDYSTPKIRSNFVEYLSNLNINRQNIWKKIRNFFQKIINRKNRGSG